MKDPTVIKTRYTALDERKHHYDLDGFPDLDCYDFLIKAENESIIDEDDDEDNFGDETRPWLIIETIRKGVFKSSHS